MEVMKDVSILFHRDKCFFFGCQVSIPLSFKLIGTYHNIRCIGWHDNLIMFTPSYYVKLTSNEWDRIYNATAYQDYWKLTT